MEITLAAPIPCLVDGQPAEIIGYGADNTVDYIQNGEQHWLHCHGSRLVMPQQPPQHDWHVDYHYRFRMVNGQ